MIKKIITSVITLVFLSSLSAQKNILHDTIRGTWITNVASDVLLSKANIIKAVNQCKENKLNHIFVVVWNNGVTMYPSKVVEKYIGIKQSTRYKNFDPIACIIQEAHKQNIKVHAWFEFGFSFAYKDTTGKWAKKYPHWIGRKRNGEMLNKNGFYWWNALHPEPQKFLTELVSEVVTKYNIDGVQGDDRMPANPSEGGYDAYSLQLYFNEHNGKQPPLNAKDTTFVNWKSKKLNLFAKEIYKKVKLIKPNCLVTWAPSIYPWCKQEYLQDWPVWLQDGYADYIIPQLYRYKIDAYEKVLIELNNTVPSNLKHKVFPGILTSLGDGYQSSTTLTQQMIDLNRKFGFNGEVFFSFETLNRLKEKIYK
jgi:uncharacterized lipoprotein YddW (UPF0748 family)